MLDQLMDSAWHGPISGKRAESLGSLAQHRLKAALAALLPAGGSGGTTTAGSSSAASMASASSHLLHPAGAAAGAGAMTFSPPPSPYSAAAGAFGRSHPLPLGCNSSDASDDGNAAGAAVVLPPTLPPPEAMLEEDDAVASLGVVSALEAAPPVAMPPGYARGSTMPSAFGGSSSLLATSLGWVFPAAHHQQQQGPAAR